MSPAPLESILDLAPYAPGLSIDEIRIRYKLSEVVKLASNENPLGAPPLAVEAVRKNAASIFRYPRGGNPLLVETLAQRHGVDQSRIAIGNGSDEIIDTLMRVLATPGKDNIVCFDPCFSIYPIQAHISHLSVRRVKLGSGFSFDFDALLAKTDQHTRLVFITTPDNPTGYCPPAAAVENFACGLAEKCPAALLLVDEAYMDFSPEEKEYSLLARNKLLPNTGFLRTFSKSWGLAGLRIGYAVLPADVADAFWRARLPFSVNILAEKAAIAALADTAFREAVLETVAAGRLLLSKALRDLGCEVFPSAANFLLFAPPRDLICARDCFEKLLERGIIIRGLQSYSMPDYLRVSIGSPRENHLFLEAMADILKKAGA